MHISCQAPIPGVSVLSSLPNMSIKAILNFYVLYVVDIVFCLFLYRIRVLHCNFCDFVAYQIAYQNYYEAIWVGWEFYHSASYMYMVVLRDKWYNTG